MRFLILMARTCDGEANGSGPMSSGTSVREESEERSSILRPFIMRGKVGDGGSGLLAALGFWARLDRDRDFEGVRGGVTVAPLDCTV